MTHNTFPCSFNDDMEQKQIEEHLKHWKRLHTDLMWVYEAMSRLTGAMPDCKLMRPVFEVWAAYTEAVGKLITSGATVAYNTDGTVRQCGR